MGDKEWVAENLFDLFGDKLARNIILLLTREPMAADELAERFGVSKPTIYRRINALSEFDLIAERQEVNDLGHHYKTYETVLQDLRVDVTEEQYEITLTKEQDLVGQFQAFWSDLGDETPSSPREVTISFETNTVDENLPNG